MLLDKLNDTNLYYYVAGGGGALIVLAVLGYFVGGSRLKVPAVVVAAVSGLVGGVALGMLLMVSLGYKLQKEEPTDREDPRARMARSGPPGGGGGGAGGGGMMAMMMRRPTMQLANLVDKMELLTRKPLTLRLSDEQRQQVRKQLQGLADVKELSDKEAKKRLDAILVVVKGDKDALSAVGYRWPEEGQGGRGGMGGGMGGGRGGMRPPPANPFREGSTGEHLKALNKQLGWEETESSE